MSRPSGKVPPQNRQPVGTSIADSDSSSVGTGDVPTSGATADGDIASKAATALWPGVISEGESLRSASDAGVFIPEPGVAGTGVSADSAAAVSVNVALA